MPANTYYTPFHHASTLQVIIIKHYYRARYRLGPELEITGYGCNNCIFILGHVY